MYFSPSQNLVRVDEAYDGSLAASIFDYKNVTQDGRVLNTMYSYTEDLTNPDVWSGYVVSNFPLFKADMLVEKGAVFGGLVERDLLKGKVAAVSSLDGPGGENAPDLMRCSGRSFTSQFPLLSSLTRVMLSWVMITSRLDCGLGLSLSSSTPSRAR